MTKPDEGPGSTLGYDHARQLDAACDAFEAAWKQDAGARPSLQEHLDQLQVELREAALLELLPLEIAYLQRRGEAIPIDDYRVRYPLAQSYLDGWIRDQSLRQVPHRLAPGDRFGKYTILAWLGAGGMGEVYRASDPSLGREVAIKILLHRHQWRPEALASIDVEAHALAALKHPHIVTVHEFAQHEGVPYMVLELLEGETLAQRLHRSRLAPDEVLPLAGQLASALAVAHEKRIVHRDLKPQNIFLTEGGQAKILDFGLARLLEAPAADTPGVQAAAAHNGDTAAGARLGTTGYMSPEQIRGKAVGAGSDIFSFGCVLYEMVCGTPAFARKTIEASDAAILHELAPQPASLRRGPQADLGPVVARCLQKAADGRYASGRELSQELQRLQDKRTRRAGQAFRGLERVLLVAVCLLAVAIGGWIWQRASERWEFQRVQAQQQGTLSRITALPNDSPNMEDLETWVKEFHESAQEVGYPDGKLRDVRAKQYSTMMAFLEREGGTKAGIEAAIKHFESALSEDGGFAAAHVGLGMCHYLLSSAYAPPRESMEKLMDNVEGVIEVEEGMTPESLATAHVLLALYYHRYKWNWNAAQRHFDEALSIDPRSTMALHYYGNSLVLQKKIDEGIQHLHRALDIDPNSAELKVDLGLAYLYLGEDLCAEYLLRGVLDEDSRNFAAHWALGEVYLHRGDYYRAARELEIAHVLDKDNAEALAELANCLGKAPDASYETSAGQIAGELADRVRNQIANPDGRHVSYSAWAVAQLGAGDRDSALNILLMALANQDEWLVWLEIDPVFDELRNTEGFREIRESIGLWTEAHPTPAND